MIRLRIGAAESKDIVLELKDVSLNESGEPVREVHLHCNKEQLVWIKNNIRVEAQTNIVGRRLQ